MKQELPTGWSLAKISDLCLFVTSGSRGWGKYYSNEGPRFIRVGDFCRNAIALNLEGMAHVQPPAGAEGRRTSVELDDVMLTITADVGMPAVAQKNLGEAYVNQHVALIRLLPGLDGRAFAYGLLDPVGLQRLVRASQYGATKPGLSLIQVRDFEVKVAPVPEQHRIVEALDSYLSRLDAAEEGLKRVEANLKRYRASVLKAAVEGRLVPTEAELARQEGRDYEPASVLLERILKERRRRWEEAKLAKMAAKGKVPKSDKWKTKYREPVEPNMRQLPRMPAGWCWTTVDQLTSGKPYSLTDGPFGSNLKTAHYTDSGPMVVRLQNIGEGLFLNAEAHISEEHYRTLSKHHVKKGDIVIASLGVDLPRACIVPRWLGPAIVKADCIRFVPDETLAEAIYVMWALNSQPTRVRTKDLVHGVGRPRVGLTLLREVAIPLPPLLEQRRIALQLERMLEKETVIGRDVRVSRLRIGNLRPSILKCAFEGKLVDQDPTEEPASALLERARLSRSAAATRAKDSQQSRLKGKGQKTVNSRDKNRSLVDVLRDAGNRLPPEELMRRSGFDADSIESFYEELRTDIQEGRIAEHRPTRHTVELRLVSP